MHGHQFGGHAWSETRRSFDEQLQEIRTEVVKLAAKSCEQIGAATQALLDADLPLVDADLRRRTSEIEGRWSLQVEHQVYQLFALQQPMASDLRALLAVLRILHEIELTAGLMRNVARATRRLYPRELPPRIRGHHRAHGRAGQRADPPRRRRVRRRRRSRRHRAPRHGRRDGRPPEGAVPRHLRRLRRRAGDEAALQMAVQLAFVGRDYERAADHAVMIGRWVAFMVTGRAPRRRPTAARWRLSAGVALFRTCVHLSFTST